MKEYREGLQVETPAGPLGQAVQTDKATEAVFSFLRNTRIGFSVTVRRAPEEERDGSEAEDGRPPSPFKNVPFLSTSFRPCLCPIFCGCIGRKEKGEHH